MYYKSKCCFRSIYCYEWICHCVIKGVNERMKASIDMEVKFAKNSTSVKGTVVVKITLPLKYVILHE